ncbi:hypothetical protein GCM10008927_13420 [Amylibacter ulvae]|uniref:DUF3800 domain-containing protein n=1 Tax=Paramylibacter ulvae TaxID=1651968 RepID=A0ABQ3D0S4_9RHOB|nr:DUF3800 domain-containing protein [Amylibacter ulvae]GHA49803.1 hypothetical protein GCM10008927_13420 [Amylibacter ulvae]
MPIYIFLDEGGDLNFSATGTKYYTITCVAMTRPFELHTKLDTYKYDLIEYTKKPRIDLEYFHCAEDNKHVRNRVLNLLAEGVSEKSVDVVVVEKSKTGPALQVPEKFYPKMMSYVLDYAIKNAGSKLDEVVVITDSLPIKKKRNAVEKAIKLFLADRLAPGTPYRIMHHASKAHYGLQIADYLNWAVYRKWERQDTTAYDMIRHLIRSEFDIFRSGSRHYY